jgi:hypothetical protein
MITQTLRRLFRGGTPHHPSRSTRRPAAVAVVAEPMEGRVLMSATGLNAGATALCTPSGGEVLPHEGICFSYAKIEY